MRGTEQPQPKGGGRKAAQPPRRRERESNDARSREACQVWRHLECWRLPRRTGARARWQFDLFVRRRCQCDLVLNAVFHDTCLTNSFTSEGGSQGIREELAITITAFVGDLTILPGQRTPGGQSTSARQTTTPTMMSKTTERCADLDVAKHSPKLEAAVARSSSLDADATALQAVAHGHHAYR